MGSFSILGIILCSVFGIMILCFIAELFYIFWCYNVKQNNNRDHQNKKYSTKMLSFLCFWKNPISAIHLNSIAETSIINNQETEDLENGLKELVEESVEAELIRLHNLCGPPRFLFTINEETKEDLLESEKGSRRFLDDSPLSLNSPLHHNGFNPLFESISERELFNKLRGSSSPPPTFKFLRDAEEKLMKRLLIEDAAKKGGIKNGGEEKDGSFLNGKKQREKGIHMQEVSVQNSSYSKVLPLATSPSRSS